MKKSDMILKLDEWKIDHDDNFKNVQKLYYAERKIREVDLDLTEDIVNETNDEVIDIFQENKIRNILIKEIIYMFKNIVGKKNGTKEEINNMFRLYNAFYKRMENPSCSVCVNNVYQKMLILYKKYKSYYD